MIIGLKNQSLDTVTAEAIISKVKQLNLPKGSYVVFGSCPLAIAGIRDAEDIDLVVSKEVLKKLRDAGWEELYKSERDIPLVRDCFEAHDSWNFSSYNPTLEELLKNATEVQDIPFASLEDVMKWKRASGRPKDLADINLINKYLNK